MWEYLSYFDDFFWHYAFWAIILVGLFLTIKSKGFQFRVLMNPSIFFHKSHDHEEFGVHPVKLFFASVGGMIGLGNLVLVMLAVSVGGPGAMFWLWLAALLAMPVKYAEIYLGIKYREKDGRGHYHGGPMYFLKHAFNQKWILISVALFLSIYGVEIAQFVVITDSLVSTFHMNKIVAIILLMSMVFYTCFGGIKRLSNICAVLMPPFILGYMIMGLWILFAYSSKIPEVLNIVFKEAFTGSAATGGFLGSTMFLAAQQGTQRAVYSGDLAIGYDSVIQSQSRVKDPAEQARFAIFGVFIDSIVCTISLLLLMVTDLWKVKMEPSEYIATIIKKHVVYGDYFVVILIFLAGFTTITAYFTVAVKCAEYINKKYGKIVIAAYALFAFPFFSFFEQKDAVMIMSLCSAFLVMFNLTGIAKLSSKIEFKYKKREVKL